MKRDLSKPLAPTFGSSPKRTKTVTRNADGSTTKTRTRTRKGGSLAKSVTKTVTPSKGSGGKTVTRDVQKHSKAGDKVTLKNRTTQSPEYGFQRKRTTVVKAKLSNRKGKDDYHLTSASVKEKASTKMKGEGKGRMVTTEKARGTGNKTASNILGGLRGKSRSGASTKLRGYTRPTKGKRST
tara:strand:- start:1 stop:546 length:546 start_codon:yes stop_codon:yes gene_type:complete